MYHKLAVRFPWASRLYEEVAIDDINIDYVKPGEPGKSLVYDMDGVLCFEVDMPYEELVARLNGQEVPKKPVVVDVDCWGVFSGEKLIMAFDNLGYAERFKDKMGHPSMRVVHMKGNYTRG